MPLSKVSKVIVQFSPWEETRGVRELLSRITSSRARACNPDCSVDYKLRTDGEPKILVEYSNKQRELIHPAGQTAEEILKRIKSHSQDDATKALLKKTGLEGTKLETQWGLSGVHNAGSGQKVPIT